MVRGQFHGDLSIEVNDHKEFLRLLLIVYYLVDPVACPRDLELLYMPVFTDKDAITEEMNECFRLAGLEEISYEQLSRT
ncbi:predicted protein [Sclerotinia sclerotiorum 1980 UF-70]|uniref:Uncharacterized protein n=1 Tax=Sclerotinia sclerotiorum (strain ATCC 18683 / 1980 / Ss-1) TaxID=665079 RepID=A7ELD7_SCLS1|nr:predicted protein [Sclerotinia sclerotiorum 1980 UF-70]EDO03653.1 predicted protein [Sclerotinia sclerotiorum 1980 UF-70]